TDSRQIVSLKSAVCEDQVDAWHPTSPCRAGSADEGLRGGRLGQVQARQGPSGRIKGRSSVDGVTCNAMRVDRSVTGMGIAYLLHDLLDEIQHKCAEGFGPLPLILL